MTGEHYIWEFSHLNTDCFSLFLEKFAATYGEDIHILQLDNGAFHLSHNLQVPKNIILLFQPPHTQATFWGEASPQKLAPQVNPIERLWQEIKRHLSWESFYTLDELRDFIGQRLEKLNTSIVASITGWDVILDGLFVSEIL